MEFSASRFRFIDLAEDLFRELRLDPPDRNTDDSLPLIVTVEVDGESLTLEHAERLGADRIVLECRFGAVPPQQAVTAFTRLLQINQNLPADCGAAFAADEQTEEVVYMRSVSLDGATARGLLDHMVAIVGLAKDWRSSWFGAPQPAPVIGQPRLAMLGA